MKQLTIISGKGGTGKTSVTAALAALAQDAVVVDCDVDAPDLHLLAKPQIRERHSFTGGKRASIQADKCCACGRCAKVCRFEAISLNGPGNGAVAMTCRIDLLACEGCLACVQVCPADAIYLHDVVNGEWFASISRLGPMVHACLYPGHENSGKLVSLVRHQARKIAQGSQRRLVLIDGPPGIGCPVIASITGADMVLAVTEPTRSGLHDLKRVLDLASQLRVPSAVCVNRWDMNPSLAGEIEATARESGALVAGRLRSSRAVVEAQVRGLSVTEYTREGIARDIRELWSRLAAALGMAKHLQEVGS